MVIVNEQLWNLSRQVGTIKKKKQMEIPHSHKHVYAARIQSIGTVEVRPLLMGKLTE